MTKADPFPTFRRWLRPVWEGARVVGREVRWVLRGLLQLFFGRRALILYMIVFALGCVAVYIDEWTGRRAWMVERERLKAEGDTLDIRHLLTPRPPDAENFFAIPELAALESLQSPWDAEGLVRELSLRRREVVITNPKGYSRREIYYFSGDEVTASFEECGDFFRRVGLLPPEPVDAFPARELLRVMEEKWQPYFDALYAASDRPVAVLLPTLQERMAGEGDGIWTGGQAMVIGRIEPALFLHGRAAAAAGDEVLAGKDWRVLTKLEDAFLANCGLGSYFHSAGHVRRALLEVLREGVQRHLWTAEQLDAFAAGSDPAALFPLWRSSLANRRYMMCRSYQEAAWNGLETYSNKPREPSFTERIREFYERHFAGGVALRACADYSRDVSRCLALLPAEVPVEGWPAALRKLGEARSDEGSYRTWDFLELLSYWDTRRFVVIVCALERHYLAHGRYPAALSGLTPPLPAELLPDTDGQPLRYGTGRAGAIFCLWSAGKDGNLGVKWPGDDLVVLTE